MSRLIAIVSCLAIVLLLFSTKNAQAAKFSEVFLRLDRTKTSSPLSGTLCAKPSSESAGVENEVSITFPSDFTIDTTVNNWTVTTTNLPSGATAWPSIGTATAVSGQTITFPSNDLTSSTSLYCFNFTGSLSTTGSAGAKTGTIATKNLSDQTIDETNYKLTILANDQISVTGTVPAKPTDFQASLALTNSGSTFSQNTELSYILTYGSYLLYSHILTVEVSWSQGTIEGNSTPSVDILEYVIGSASEAHNNTPPVVDTTNRKITWTISSFSANTVNKTVNFKLKTTSAYTGSKKVSFIVSGKVLGQGTQTADSTVTKDYAYTTTPTSTPTPAPATSPTPLPKPPAFERVWIRTVSAEEATIAVQTSEPTTLIFRYGTAPNKLANTVRVLTAQTLHLLLLADLSPNTQYYFRITAADTLGRTAISDIFIFKTAKTSAAPTIDKTTIIIQSQEILLSSQMLRTAIGTNEVVVVLPTEVAFSFSFLMEKHEVIKRAEAFFSNKLVLGINTIIEEVQASSQRTEPREIAPGLYSGTLKTPASTGIYEFFLRIHDFDGNIAEEKIAEIKISQPFSIKETENQTPIENARVFLFKYNERTRTYEPISQQVIGIKNPSFSEPNGTVPVVLPQGRYRAEVKALGYKEKTFDFDIAKESDYPIIHLEKTGFSLITAGKYYLTIAEDIVHATQTYTKNLSTSNRFFNFTAFISLIFLVVVSLLSFSLRTHIPLLHLPRYLIHHIRRLIPKTSLLMHIHGIVIDATVPSPINQADVYIIDENKKVIVEKILTNKAGEFFSNSLPNGHYAVRVMKRGYKLSEIQYPLPDDVSGKFAISLHKGETLEQSIRENFYWAVENVIGFCFELLLFTSLVFEVLLGYAFGWQKIAPFLFVSLANLLMWLFYFRHISASKS